MCRPAGDARCLDVRSRSPRYLRRPVRAPCACIGDRDGRTMIRRWALAVAGRGRLSVLILHRVLAAPDPLLPSEPTSAQFDALLGHVKRQFNVLPLTDAVSRLYAGTLPSRALSITFDDGYADNLTVAAPILKAHGLPATVFVATGCFVDGCMWNDMVIEAVRTTSRPSMDLESAGLGNVPVASVEQKRAAIDLISPRSSMRRRRSGWPGPRKSWARRPRQRRKD